MPVLDKELAKDISGRMKELLDMTGFTIEGLALFCDVKSSYLKSVYYGNAAISVEWVKKISGSFNISLIDFFTFGTDLMFNSNSNKKVTAFTKIHFESHPEYFTAFAKPAEKASPETNKYVREKVAAITLQTDYFETGKTIEQIKKDFAKEFGLKLESGRLYELLAKYVGNELKKKPVIKNKADGEISKRKIYQYIKAKPVNKGNNKKAKE